MSESCNLELVEFKPLSSEIDISQFDCGDPDLNDFLKTDALKYQNGNFAHTTCLFYQDKLIGFYALACDALRLSNNQRRKDRIRFKKSVLDLPAVKIARMGIINELKGKKVGTLAMNVIKGMTIAMNKQRVAVKYLTVDAYRISVDFYKRAGFLCNIPDQEKDPERKTISMRFKIDVINGG